MLAGRSLIHQAIRVGKRLTWSLLAVAAGTASAQLPSSPPDAATQDLRSVPLQDLTVPQVPSQPTFDPPVLDAAPAQPQVAQPPPQAPDPAVTQPPPLPTDPGPSLPPELQNIAPEPFRNVAATFGATAGSFSASPTMMGDIFTGGFSFFSGTQTATFDLTGPGFIVSGAPGDPNAELAFQVGSDGVPNDIFTTGLGTDGSGDGLPDTFQLLEPVPPSDAPTSPGPGFVFNGGAAVYVEPDPSATTPQNGRFENGDSWFIRYSYIGPLNGQPPGRGILAIPGPGVGVRRVKLSENFSPEVRDRFFFNFNFFNDAFAGLRDVSRYTFGFEKVIRPRLVSLEFRLPTAGTFGSTQVMGQVENRDFELGNPAVVAKGVLLREGNFIWTGGLGVTLPLADDSRLRTQTGQDLLVIRNQTVHMLPFTAIILRPNRTTRLQSYLQLDVAANGDPVFGNLTSGSLQKMGVFNDSTLLYADLAVNKTVYKNRCSDCLREVMLNAELHYTATLQDSDVVQGGGLTYANLKDNFNVVNATLGMHMVLANNVIVSPAFAVPLRDGLDKQFDYEAIVQLNYLR